MPDATPTACEIHLLARLPVFSTRLVRQADFTYPDRPQVRSPADLAGLLLRYFEERDREELVAVLLDTGKSVIGLVRLSVGGRNQAVFEPAQLFKAAILAGADSVVLAHNHPSGNTEPSRADVAITRAAVEAGYLMGVPVHDHLIIGDGYVSIAERGLL